MSLQKKQVINNGQVLMEVGNLVHMINRATVQMVFEVVNIENGYVVLEALDYKKFNNELAGINKFVTGKPIVKGLIEYGNRIKC